MLTDVSHSLNLFKIGLVTNESLILACRHMLFLLLSPFLGGLDHLPVKVNQSLDSVENVLEKLKHFFTISDF